MWYDNIFYNGMSFKWTDNKIKIEKQMKTTQLEQF